MLFTRSRVDQTDAVQDVHVSKIHDPGVVISRYFWPWNNAIQSHLLIFKLFPLMF